jgi:hypothetical protein
MELNYLTFLRRKSSETGKRKPRQFSLIRLSFAYRSNGSLSFACFLTKTQTEIIRLQTAKRTIRTCPSMFFNHGFLCKLSFSESGIRHVQYIFSYPTPEWEMIMRNGRDQMIQDFLPQIFRFRGLFAAGEKSISVVVAPRIRMIQCKHISDLMVNIIQHFFCLSLKS